MEWINAKTDPPKKSGHYEVINKNGERGRDDYSTEKKIWWNFEVAFWRPINEV